MPRWQRTTTRPVRDGVQQRAHPRVWPNARVRGFLKWIGARWEETLLWSHADNEAGSVARTRSCWHARAPRAGA